MSPKTSAQEGSNLMEIEYMKEAYGLLFEIEIGLRKYIERTM